MIKKNYGFTLAGSDVWPTLCETKGEYFFLRIRARLSLQFYFGNQNVITHSVQCLEKTSYWFIASPIPTSSETLRT